ncbi:MAG TPA: SDR family oxidoreductase [Chthoniobacterales bacterium]|nr:SDR family oxidoreductase [Chthoniobacterales bacterium]
MLLKLILFVLIPYAILLSILLARKAPQRKTTKSISRGWGNRLRILIIGATGGTGRELVRQALEQGHQVTALARKPEKLTLEHPNLRVVQGNVHDYDSVESAMRGQSAVLCALGTKRFSYPNRVASNGTANILRAMKTCNVPRLVCESSLGVGNSVGRLGLLFTFFVVPLLLPFIFYDKVRQEKLIEESDTDWVIVRPAVLTNAPARSKYRHGRNMGNYLWTNRIARADVADFMLQQLTDDDYIGSAVGVVS